MGKKKKYIKQQKKVIPLVDGLETSGEKPLKKKKHFSPSSGTSPKKIVPKNTIQPKKVTTTALVPAKKAEISLITPPREKNSHPRLVKILKKTAFYFSGVMAVAAILIVIGLHSDERIYPRVTLGPLEIGYEPLATAKTQITKSVDDYLKQPLVFSSGDNQVTLTPQELGVKFMLPDLINDLPYYQFRKSNPLNFFAALLKEKKLPLKFAYDNDKIVNILEQKLNLNDLKPKDAHFYFDDKKTIQIEPEKQGKLLDQMKLLAALDQNISQLQQQPISIDLTDAAPNVLATQLTQRKEELLAQVKQPITLMYEGRKWELKLLEHVEAVGFENKVSFNTKKSDEESSSKSTEELKAAAPSADLIATAEINLNPEKIDDFLQKEIIAKINKPTTGVKISKNDTGKILIDGKGHNGLSVDKKMLLTNINAVLNDPDKARIVQIPVNEEKAPVEISSELQKLGIKNMIATGHTSFVGSHNARIHNINTGIGRYNGLLVKPGETFSFNDHLGEVDAKNGYLPEKVIKENKAVNEYGGGLCQVSSTAYRAALLGGLKIAERAPHSWRVNYYEQVLGPGLDATIYPGSRDFKFVNDTPGHILIQSYTEGEHAYFKFYGTDDGRKATLDGPYGKGLNFKWYRNLIKDGVASKETIISNYRPMPNPNATPVAPKPTLNFDVGGTGNNVPNTLTLNTSNPESNL